jgi:hypothetical protein
MKVAQKIWQFLFRGELGGNQTQDGDKGDEVTGEEEGHQARRDPNAPASWDHMKSACGKHVRNHTPLKHELQDEESDGDSDESGEKTSGHYPPDHFGPCTRAPGHHRIDDCCGDPHTEIDQD